MSLKQTIKTIAKNAKEAARGLRKVDRAKKDAALRLMSRKLLEEQGSIKQENMKDVEQARKTGLSSAMIDRLTLDEKTIKAMADSLNEVADLPDPVGEVTGMWKRPNGLLVGGCR